MVCMAENEADVQTGARSQRAMSSWEWENFPKDFKHKGDQHHVSTKDRDGALHPRPWHAGAELPPSSAGGLNRPTATPATRGWGFHSVTRHG